MAQRQIKFSELRKGEKVTAKLRDGESVIVGTVTELPTNGGGARITLTNNRNSIVIYEYTNFRIFAEREATVQEILGDLPVGVKFSYRNKYDKTITWIKTGNDRVTKVDDTRPAYSLSISAGFTDQGDTVSARRVTVLR